MDNETNEETIDEKDKTNVIIDEEELPEDIEDTSEDQSSFMFKLKQFLFSTDQTEATILEFLKNQTKYFEQDLFF